MTQPALEKFMELSSFETAAFNQRRSERVDINSSSMLYFIRKSLPGFVVLGVVICTGLYLPTKMLSNSIAGNILTPNRLLVLVTVFLIGITPILKRKRTFAPTTVDQQQTTKPIPSHPTLQVSSPARPLFSRIDRLDSVSPSCSLNPISPHLPHTIGPVPTRYETVGITPRKFQTAHSPAPFVDDIHSVQRHEYTDILPRWAKAFEDQVLMPLIVNPLVKALNESDALLNQAFTQFGLRLSHSDSLRKETGVVYLTDRFLPSPLCNISEVNAIWQRRQLIESLVTIPSFPHSYRDYVVSRITTWADRRGIRFSYRHDNRPDDNGPTDSHILAHILFASFDTQMSNGYDSPFRDRFVTEAKSGQIKVDDDFTALFGHSSSSIGNKSSSHLSKLVWLEQTNRPSGPLHFNVATNQKVYGIAQGGGNIFESLCLFFHLLKKLSPNAVWIHIPHEIRMVLDSIIGSTNGLSGGLLSGFGALGYTSG